MSLVGGRRLATLMADAAYAGVCSWRALHAHWLALPVQALASPGSAPSWEWTGQIFSRRSLHRDILFLSLCTDGSGGLHGGVEVLLRRDVLGDAAMDAANYSFKCGAVLRVAGIGEVTVNMVFDPPWTPERMSEEARLELNMF